MFLERNLREEGLVFLQDRPAHYIVPTEHNYGDIQGEILKKYGGIGQPILLFPLKTVMVIFMLILIVTMMQRVPRTRFVAKYQ